ncbi:dynactin-associated protein [Orycteropus afer afer]|uniref:Dynactin-associated protein n=1 Tax=Orycteropus afer afer TaxID=1230840 RepID=A0AC54Z0J2_ORYAF|nr:dynactin-associated protein [Orycteropus afer afer]
MDRKQEKCVVNIEHSGNQPPITFPNDQEAHNSAQWCPHSNDTPCDVCSDLPGVCVNPGMLTDSGCPHTELSNGQVKGNCCTNWSLWKVFLACLLACVITTAVGVLIVCLVNNRWSNNGGIVIQLPQNNGEPVVIIPGRTSTTSQSTVTTTSTKPTTDTISSVSATTASSIVPTIAITTSTQSTATNAITSTESTMPTATTTMTTPPPSSAATTIN